MRRILIAAAICASPLLAARPAAADTIYPWCLYDMRGGVNCGFVSWGQCMAAKTGNADMCLLHGLYHRAPRADERPGYGKKRIRHYR